MSDELRAYTLSDPATFVARQAQGVGLVILVEGDPLLFNSYGVIPVNPEKHPGVVEEIHPLNVGFVGATRWVVPT